MSFLRCCAVALLSLLVLALQVAAETYPERVIRIVNPFPPGGSVDVTARILAQKLSENLGQQVIVENRAGAGGNTGADSVAKAEADGYTLLFTAPGPLVINQTLYTKGLPFDPTRDFAPVALFAVAPIVLMVHPGVAAQNVQELIALAKAQPGNISFASAGNGSTNHLAGEMFKSMAKIDIVHVPYRGAGPAMNDLIGGHVQTFFDLLPSSLPQIKTGKVRALGNAGAQRPAALANLPTVAEQGLPGFDASSWMGLVAPAKTPAPVLARLSEEIARVLKEPDMIVRIRELGSEPGHAFGAAFGTFMHAETAKWAEVIRTSGAKAE
ncbi:MAG: Bug family tripartite tricarboxylate transporter substrate binding protein [Xanthobacteraceae bacterium]|jgi:tripartite-type tricarboxylate transporter receptor subunit TctC